MLRVLSGFGRGMLGPAPADAAPVPAAAAVGLAWEEGDNGSELSGNALTLVVVVVVIAVLQHVLLLLLKFLMVALEVGGRFKLMTSNGSLEVIAAMGVKAAVTGSTGAKVVGGTLVAGIDGDDGSADMGAGYTMEDVLAATDGRGTGCSVIGSAIGTVMGGVGIVVGITGGATVGEAPVAAVMRDIRVAVAGRAPVAGFGGS